MDRERRARAICNLLGIDPSTNMETDPYDTSTPLKLTAQQVFEQYVAAIEQSDAEAGMVMVPREPTKQMVVAGLAEPFLIENNCGQHMAAMYKAMIQAYENSHE